MRVQPEAELAVAHPRRFGLACHLGVPTGLPAIGVAKRRLIGTFDELGLGSERGAWSPFRDGDEVVGLALRTRPGAWPVFVSVGHRFDLATACQQVLDLFAGYRLPETTARRSVGQAHPHR